MAAKRRRLAALGAILLIQMTPSAAAQEAAPSAGAANGEATVIDYSPAVRMVLQGRLLLESNVREDERAFILSSTAAAESQIVKAYGERKAPLAKIVWCKTYSCALFFGGPSTRSFATRSGPNARGGLFDFDGPAIVLLRQVRADAGADLLVVETLTHEMSHQEFFARLNRATVPAWFNEGVATYLGKEHRCADHARGIDNLDSLTRSADWNAHVERNSALLAATYCQARNEVAAWIDAHGGFAVVPDLLDRVAAGAPFASVFAARAEQPDLTAPPTAPIGEKP